MTLRPSLLILLFALLSAPALAADDVSEARAHFDKGSKAYELGLFDEAIAEYTEAYKLKDDPAFLYNLGQAHRLAGHAAEALRFFRMYLIKEPASERRDDVLGKIEVLRGKVETQAAAPSTAGARAVTSDTSARADKPRGRSTLVAGVSLGAVGLGALAAGLGCGLGARDDANTLAAANAGGRSFDAALYRQGERLQSAEVALLVVGGAVTIAGGALIIVGARQRRAGARAMVHAWR